MGIISTLFASRKAAFSRDLTVLDVLEPDTTLVEEDKRTFVIERQPKQPSQGRAGLDEYPWYVQETTFGDDRDDYGRMATQPEALALVESMLNGQRNGKGLRHE